MRQEGGSRMLLGFVVLHVLCCGVPLLIAGGALGGVGALLSSPVLLVAGAVALLFAAVTAVRAVRARRDACCASDPVSEPAKPPYSSTVGTMP